MEAEFAPRTAVFVPRTTIVHCRDCKHWDAKEFWEGTHVCHGIDNTPLVMLVGGDNILGTAADFFCALGERPDATDDSGKTLRVVIPDNELVEAID